MGSVLDKLKSDLLLFGKKNRACKDEYGRLYAAETVDEVIEVVKDNFWWCAKSCKDFTDVIITHRELFGKYQVFANQDIEISGGEAYLCVSEGEFSVTSYDKSSIHVYSYGTSTINVKSCHLSTISIESYNASIINTVSYGASTINVNSNDISIVNVESYDTSMINASSGDKSTINVKSCHASIITAASYNISAIDVASYDTSILKADSFNASMIDIESYGASTMIILTPSIECNVHDHSIARYVHENRIVTSGDWLTVEKR